MKSFFSAIGFLTILPVPGQARTPDRLAVLYFPLVGFLIGGILIGFDFLLTGRVPNEVRAAFDVLILAVLTGGLHLDGLADTADGLFSHRPRERMLEIMRDSHIGVMGTVALILCLIFKFSALIHLHYYTSWVWMLTAPAWARTAQVVGLTCADYAGTGTATADSFYQKGRFSLLAFGVIPFLILFGVEPVPGILAGLFFIVLNGGMLMYFRNKIGGVTGDTLGALSEVNETSFLILGTLII